MRIFCLFVWNQQMNPLGKVWPWSKERSQPRNGKFSESQALIMVIPSAPWIRHLQTFSMKKFIGLPSYSTFKLLDFLCLISFFGFICFSTGITLGVFGFLPQTSYSQKENIGSEAKSWRWNFQDSSRLKRYFLILDWRAHFFRPTATILNQVLRQSWPKGGDLGHWWSRFFQIHLNLNSVNFRISPLFVLIVDL